MKDRILEYLQDFINDKNDSLAMELKAELKLDDQTFQQNCNELRSEILHHYDQFSISTIDAFFQRVIRTFTREAGLVGDYRLEVDQKAVLEEVINNLIDELGDKPELTKWVVEYARENLENDRTWDVRSSLMEFGEEIFREEFKAIEEQVRQDTANPDFFPHFRAELWKVKNNFLSRISKPAMETLQLIDSKGWVGSDFKYRGVGLFSILKQFAYGKSLKDYKEPIRMRNEWTFSKNWPFKNIAKASEIFQLAEERLVPCIKEILEVYDNDYMKALSAEVVLQNMYVFGLLSDIARKLQDYKSENNLMLLADAPKFLNRIIDESDTPFVYERVGSFYRNYLIDEFQDTSRLQWKNFFPLVANSLDQGFPSVAVGDVKQAVYRWRGGDLNLLEYEVVSQIGEKRVTPKELGRNFRSAKNIISFNNALFKTAASLVSAETGSALATSAYRDVTQQDSMAEDGFVKITFLRDEEETKWKDFALDRVPHHLETLQKAGIALREIAILVRYNAEGHDVATHLLQYKNSGKALEDCKYDVVSNESLRLDGAASVNLLLGAMRYLLNPEDAIARAQLSYEFAKLHEPGRNQTEVFAVTNQVFFESQLPDAFTKEKLSLKKLPLFELTETIIEIFKLGKEQGELAYVQAFQDLVLEFYTRERNDLASFLEWWEENKGNDKGSIKISGEVDAARILTVHKAKGLEFKYVIIPFCSWDKGHERGKSPNLWVKVDQAPFSEAGFLPVKYGGTLDNTYFKEAFQEEKTRVHLDNLNLLYVALTRAEHGIIITAPHTDNAFAKTTVAHWLHDSIVHTEDLMTYWDETRQEFNRGNVKSVTSDTRAKGSIQTIELKSYFTSPWRDKLVIRQGGAPFFQGTSEQRKKINYGIYLHAVLSRIKYAGDVTGTLDRLLKEGLMTTEEKTEISNQLDDLMAIPVVGRWFSPDWDVRTEVPILLPGGKGNRIDRLMTKGKKAVVVDFKTGEKSKPDQKQVTEYMQILKQMGFVDVEGYLLYTRDQEVISMTDGKQRIVKKKDESQLGFGFDQ